MELKQSIYKSKALIFARYKLSALEHRILSLALICINPNDTILKPYKIHVENILSKIKYPDKTKKTAQILRIQTILESLPNKRIKILQDDGNYVACKIIKSACFLDFPKGNKFVELQFHDRFKYLFLGDKTDPNQFVSYYIENVIRFKSGYSFRIYELLMFQLGIGENKLSISLNELRGLLLADSKYSTDSGFDEVIGRIILKPLKDIEEYSNLTVKYEKVKIEKGNYSFILTFSLKSNPPAKYRCLNPGIETHYQPTIIESIGYSDRINLLLSKAENLSLFVKNLKNLYTKILSEYDRTPHFFSDDVFATFQKMLKINEKTILEIFQSNPEYYKNQIDMCLRLLKRKMPDNFNVSNKEELKIFYTECLKNLPILVKFLTN